MRAALRARELAARTGTPLVVVWDRKVIEVAVQPEIVVMPDTKKISTASSIYGVRSDQNAAAVRLRSNF